MGLAATTLLIAGCGTNAGRSQTMRTALEMLRLRTNLGLAATAPSMRAAFGI